MPAAFQELSAASPSCSASKAISIAPRHSTKRGSRCSAKLAIRTPWWPPWAIWPSRRSRAVSMRRPGPFSSRWHAQSMCGACERSEFSRLSLRGLRSGRNGSRQLVSSARFTQNGPGSISRVSLSMILSWDRASLVFEQRLARRFSRQHGRKDRRWNQKQHWPRRVAGSTKRQRAEVGAPRRNRTSNLSQHATAAGLAGRCRVPPRDARTRREVLFMSLSSGTRLGTYEVIAPLGAGGMGEVYRARDTRLGREVAIKVLPSELLLDDVARARLLREARLVATLNHPNICTVYEVAEVGGRIYFAMELIDGRPLSERIAEPGAGPAAEAVARYGSQMASALAHAHERGVIHRDLKSANALVTSDGRVKVLDFGVARWQGPGESAEVTRETLTQAGAIIGTTHYLAPEVLRGARADERSDLWAMGVVLHEMASGSLPFRGATSYELASAIMNELPAALPNHVPAGLRAVIGRCLMKERGERYKAAGEVHAALEALQSEGM